VNGKSKLVVAIGIYLLLGGLVYLGSPSPDESGVPHRDMFTFFMSGWLIASGVGLILHKKWAFYLYGIGAVFLPISLIIKGFQNGLSAVEFFIPALAVGAVLGVPFGLLLLRKSRFLSADGDSQDNA
jgi:hypothetical protein